MDVGELVISTGGAAVELTSAAAGGFLSGFGVPIAGDEPVTVPAGVVIGFGIGVELYQPLNAVGDTMGVIGTGMTIFNDIRAGDMYLSYQDGPGFVMPSGTQIEIVATIAGLGVNEAFADLGVDLQKHSQITTYTSRRLMNIGIQVAEGVISEQPSRWVGLPLTFLNQ
jgi:hypothetical protein